MPLSFLPFRHSMFEKPVMDKDFRRLRNIQWAALMPVMLCFLFFLLSANIYLLFLLVFLLIIGVIIPWVLREVLVSHLMLKKEIQDLKESVQPPSQEPT